MNKFISIQDVYDNCTYLSDCNGNTYWLQSYETFVLESDEGSTSYGLPDDYKVEVLDDGKIRLLGSEYTGHSSQRMSFLNI